MSQECWYSCHLRHTDEFYPCIRRGLKIKKRKHYKPPTSYIVYKPRHSTQENNQFCSMLVASGKTDCFTLCEKSKHKSRGVLPIMAYTRKLRPNCKRGTFSRLQVYERVRISIAEVYERVGKSVPIRSVKGPKRANRMILWLWKSRENFLSSFVIYSQGMESSKLGIWKGYHLSMEGTVSGRGVFSRKKNIQKGKELDLRAELNSQDKTLLRNSPHPRDTDVFYPRLAFAKKPLVRIS